MEGKEKYKPLGGKPKGYSLTEKSKKICDDEIKEYILEAIKIISIFYCS
ncbi:hypothetical protein [Clostridium novyi]|nr:hypothetical protein [Clostridium novyi]